MRRGLSLFLVLAVSCVLSPTLAAAAERPARERPNLVVIFVDDLGYGDLGCYGHPTIRTPQLDRMAREGLRMTQFYAADNVCTPSRAGLLTGRLPIRSGMTGAKRRVLFPDSKGGLPAEELTLAEALRDAGYATGCVGKWHLGHLPEYLPTRHGFDSYFGIPYSNDMDRTAESGANHFQTVTQSPRSEFFNVPILRDEKEVERPADQTTLTRRYTEEAVKFVREHAEQPFFLYLAHNLPHVPLFRSPKFAGVSRAGIYGDVVEEIDWSVGQVLDVLRELKLDENTLVVFTSDNGPWLTFGTQGGSAGLLREGKGSTWEGGMREPGIFWWPETVPAGRVSQELGSTMDLFATMLALAGREPPTERTLDSHDLTPVLLGKGRCSRKSIFYYFGPQLRAVRLGDWKAHFVTQPSYSGQPAQSHNPPLLFHLGRDPGESHNVAAQNAAVLKEIAALVAEHQAELQPAPSQLDR